MFIEMQSNALPGRTDHRWFHSQAINTGTSDPLIIPSVGRDAVVTVRPGISARVQFSASSYSKINDDTANWYDWPAGDVTVPTSDAVIGGITAIRLVSVGVSSWEVAL